MSQRLTVIMYHYVRDLSSTRYPAIKALMTSQFEEQIEYLKRNYTIVKAEDCLAALYDGAELPRKACLLTFDDGYIDHFETVFPILEKNGVKGCFFPPAKAILAHEVLDVNKIHFILASAATRLECLMNDVYRCLDKYRERYCLESNDYYYSRLAVKSRFDTADVIFIKKLLQTGLEEDARRFITGELFKKYVTADEKAFSRELYMDLGHLKSMSVSGMCIGGHGYDHSWLDNLPAEKQEREIDESIELLRLVCGSVKDWVMSYPHGGYNDSLIAMLKKKGCAMAFTSKVGVAVLSRKSAFTMKRFDTNDLPNGAKTEVYNNDE